MFATDHPAAVDRADTRAFAELLNGLSGSADPALRGFFDTGRGLTAARAPGRLDAMGGIADYSGSLVLELPLAEATHAAVQGQDAARLDVASVGDGGAGGRGSRRFSVSLAALLEGEASTYAGARAFFGRSEADRWAGYVAGAVVVLARELGVRSWGGLRILVSSEVPEGAGVSSSAALEVATMQALCGHLGLSVEPRRLAGLCQLVENRVVGAPCGIMDQVTSACGEAEKLLALRCQPATIEGLAELGERVELWGIDSGVRHAVSGSDYTAVRVGAFMGYRILAEVAGLAVRPGSRAGHVRIEDDRWGGYLANVTPAEWEGPFEREVPERMSGRAFLERYGGIPDAVTEVEPGRTYAVRTPTAHPIEEHARVRRFLELVGSAPTEGVLGRMGELMYASHASYGACGLGSDRTDALVGLVRAAGVGSGLYGAKITGGGSGGTVAVLGRSDARGALEGVVGRFGAMTGVWPHVFRGSSDGAGVLGAIRFRAVGG